MVHAASLLATLFVVWLLWSGLYKPLLITLGIASSVLVVYIARRMDTIDRESVPLQLGGAIFSYWFWLLKEIIKSNLQVMRVILSPQLPISPRIVRVQALARGEVGRVIYGNSITLTPGTVTTDIDDEGMVTVHALTEEIARDVEAGEMNRRVAALERKDGTA